MKLRGALKAMGRAARLVDPERTSDTETDASRPSLSNSNDNIETTAIAEGKKAEKLNEVTPEAQAPVAPASLEIFPELLLEHPPLPAEASPAAAETVSDTESSSMKNKRKTFKQRRVDALRAAENEAIKSDPTENDPIENEVLAKRNLDREATTGDEVIIGTKEALAEEISSLKLAHNPGDSGAAHSTASAFSENSSSTFPLSNESALQFEGEAEYSKDETTTVANMVGCGKKMNKKTKKKKEKKPADARMSSTSSTASVATVTLASSSAQRLPTAEPRFCFDAYRDELRCRKHGCGKMTNCYDGETVICPRCGVNSRLRYCSLICLLGPDMRFHWAQECGRHSLREDLFTFDKMTLIVRPAGTRPFVANDTYDNPARHRQAVYHSSNGAAGDYFIFNDFSLINTAEGSTSPVNAIGMGEVIAKAEIVPDYGLYRGKSIFHETLDSCLREGFMRPEKCLGLVDIVTRELVNTGQWRKEVQDCLFFQMKNEFAYEIPQEVLHRYDWLASGSTPT